jgi:hypothetical protein
VETAVVETAVVETAVVETAVVETAVVETAVAEAAVVEAAAVEAAAVEAATVPTTMVLRLAGTGRHEDRRSGKEQQSAEREYFPKHGYASSSDPGRKRLHHNRDARSSSYVAHAATCSPPKQGPCQRCDLRCFAS